MNTPAGNQEPREAYTLKLLNEIRAMVTHLRALLQFIGFNGSLGPFQCTKLSSPYWEDPTVSRSLDSESMPSASTWTISFSRSDLETGTWVASGSGGVCAGMVGSKERRRSGLMEENAIGKKHDQHVRGDG